MKDKAKYTHQLLTEISKHISIRPRYKYRSFIVTITDSNIEVVPPLYMYPDIHHQKPSDKDDVIAHILLYHLTDVVDKSDGTVNYKEYFSTGQYKFTLPYGSKYRQWIKLK